MFSFDINLVYSEQQLKSCVCAGGRVGCLELQ